MKKLCFALAMLVCLGCLGGCGVSLRAVYLHENFPTALDSTTLLPLIESVTVTRVSDGATVTVTGTDIDELLLCFENILCTRKKGSLASYDYTLAFTMVDAASTYPTLYIGTVKDTAVTKFGYGEYLYETINMVGDIRYILSLFQPHAA